MERELTVATTSKAELQLHFNKAQEKIEALQAELMANSRQMNEYALKIQELQPQ